MIGSTLSHFRITSKLGEGGMGVVWGAEDVDLHRPVALKVLSDETLAREDMRARFMREARTAAALNHPNICTIYEVGEVDGVPFIAMEKIEGSGLDARVSGGEALPLNELVRIARRRDDLVVLDADLASDCRVRAFELAFPERFLESGIAEQDMVSTGAGLARHGLLPVVNSFASFLASRANEQIYNQASEGSKVVYALHYAGLIPAGPGKSHQSVRDTQRLLVDVHQPDGPVGLDPGGQQVGHQSRREGRASRADDD